MIRRVPALLVFIDRRDRRQIQGIDHVAHEVHQVIRRQPVSQARRQQEVLLGDVRAIRLGHHPQCSTPIASARTLRIQMSQTITRTGS